MKNLTFIFAIIFATSSFAQFDQGTWTFGAGNQFISTASSDGYAADVSYFVADGVMVSLTLSGNTSVGEEGDANNIQDFFYVEGNMDWSLGARYYPMDNGLFVGAKFQLSEYDVLDEYGVEETNNDGMVQTENGLDMDIQIGCSKELAFDGKLWFEPMLTISKSAASYDTPLYYGIGAMFRFAF